MKRLTAKSEYDGTYIVNLPILAREDGTLPDKDAVYQMVVDKLAEYENRDDSRELGTWKEIYDEEAYPLQRRKFYCSHCGGWNTYGKVAFCMNCGWPMRKESCWNEH